MKRTVLAVLMVLIATQVSAQEVFALPPCVERFPNLPKLADRLGISPNVPGRDRSVELVMCNDDRYSLFDILNKVLDRLDAVKP